MLLKKECFIIFSSIDWSTHWQLHHQLATSLVATGNRVLFVENTGIRSVNIHDVGRLSKRISSWRKGMHGFSSIDGNNLTLYSPILLPFPYSKLSLFFNKIIFNLSISRWMKASGFGRPIIISFLPTPLIQSAINNANPKLSIYYCANNMADSSISASRVRPYEDQFFKTVDIVFTAACVIQEYAVKLSKKVFYFPPGIDFDKFDIAIKSSEGIPDDLKKISGPIIGYIGTLGRVLDQELLCTLADECSNFTIVLIGPKYTNIDKLEKKLNVVLLGAKPHNQLPYYIKGFDVGIVPYICNDFTEGVYPSKLNEYLAMGIPSVSTNLREVRESKKIYGESIIVANSVEEFIEAVKVVVVEDDALIRGNRIEVAKANSWESRFNGILRIINENIILKANQQMSPNWKKGFEKYFGIGKYVRKLLLVSIFAFFLIFYSPLFWLLGNGLVVSDAPKRSDAIVVFSGDGEASYRNSSYQKRALDAVRFYNDGYATDIFISSGRRQTISDVELIKLFLTSKDIPESSIHVLEKYPISTFQNVQMVKQMLDDDNINSILFITSPYHSRRAMLTWKKNAPNIEVIAPRVVDTPSENLKWGVSINEVRVIVYEYAAIVHNWVVGRI